MPTILIVLFSVAFIFNSFLFCWLFGKMVLFFFGRNFFTNLITVVIYPLIWIIYGSYLLYISSNLNQNFTLILYNFTIPATIYLIVYIFKTFFKK